MNFIYLLFLNQCRKLSDSSTSSYAPSTLSNQSKASNINQSKPASSSQSKHGPNQYGVPSTNHYGAAPTNHYGAAPTNGSTHTPTRKKHPIMIDSRKIYFICFFHENSVFVSFTLQFFYGSATFCKKYLI